MARHGRSEEDRLTAEQPSTVASDFQSKSVHGANHKSAELLTEKLGAGHAGAAEPANFQALLQQRFGATPGIHGGETPDYRHLIHRPTAERYAPALAHATAFVRTKIPELVPPTDAFEITESEVSATFLAEGGDLMLARKAQEWQQFPGLSRLNEYSNLYSQRDSTDPALQAGRKIVRTFERYDLPSLKPWLHASVLGCLGHWQQIPMETLLLGVAGVYAHEKARAAADYREFRGKPFGRLPPGEQLFWTTFYFTGGHGVGRAAMKHHESSRDENWNTKGKDYNAHRYDNVQPGGSPGFWFGPHTMNPYWYALRRSASMELLDEDRRKAGPDAKKD